MAVPEQASDGAATAGPGRPRRPLAVRSLAIALLITVAVFPEVVFLGGSLSSVGMNDVLDANRDHPTVSVYPNPEGLEPRSGLVDAGARVWQFEPAVKVMNRAMYDGESAEWNPYSAAGSLGPETLADMKESPFVLAVAALGASSTAFTFVLLGVVVLSLYCLQQFFVRTLEMSLLAAIAACALFLLNGWAASVLTSQTSGPYLLFPVLLYSVTEYQRIGGRTRFVVAIAAYVALFATTFLPTLFLVLLLVQSVALVLDVRRQREAHGTQHPIAIASACGRPAGRGPVDRVRGGGLHLATRCRCMAPRWVGAACVRSSRPQHQEPDRGAVGPHPSTALPLVRIEHAAS